MKSQNEWNQYRKSGKLPDDIPSRIAHIYRKQGIWKGWGDFLGTGNIATQNRIYLSAKEARIEIRKLAKEVFGGKPFTPQDWYNAHDAGKIPKNLPKILDNIYNPVSRDNRRKMEKK